MDANGARHLQARLAIGIPIGARFEVVALGDGQSPLSLGDTGTLLSLVGGLAQVRVDYHGEIEIDPQSVTLRALLKRTA